MIKNCDDCFCDFEVTDTPLEGEIFSCPNCGAEYVFQKGSLVCLDVEGEDWGE
jgi:predicted RNA-binding Zn-ribbon protein involved in translation (DUF1610 family)